MVVLSTDFAFCFLLFAWNTTITKGVFTEAVQACIVVTTREEARLVALAQNNASLMRMTLVPTNFVVASDLVGMTCIQATPQGRIFLGGQNGHLYEFDYDLMVPTLPVVLSGNTTNTTGSGSTSTYPVVVEGQLEQFYNGQKGLCPPTLTDDSSSSSLSLLTAGKRAAARLVWQKLQDASSQHAAAAPPPRKCRKVCHSQSPWTAYMPDLLSFTANTTTADAAAAAAMMQMVMDSERHVLYTLSAKGTIHVWDIWDATAPPVLRATLETPTTARLYLEAVSRGRQYAPTTSRNAEGHLAFPGGAEAAQAGVGGMEGARKILKLATTSSSSSSQSSHHHHHHKTNMLTPVSLQIVPIRESTRITLVAITASGLRYYLSSLHPKRLGTGPTPQPFETPRHLQALYPHTKMTLLHIRAPPSVASITSSTTTMTTTTGNTTNGATAPPILSSQDYKVDATYYGQGIWMAGMASSTTHGNNILVATNPDLQAYPQTRSHKDGPTTTTYVAPGGICETVSFPCAMTSATTSLPNSTILPGGRIWSICASGLAAGQNPLLTLALRSKTPTDAELKFGMAPAFGVLRPKPAKLVKTPINNSNSSKPTTTVMALDNKTNTTTSSSVSGMALTVFTNLLLSRPLKYGLPASTKKKQEKEAPQAMYRISQRSSIQGFSLSAADTKANSNSSSRSSSTALTNSSSSSSSSSTTTTRSARLSPWLLQPEVVPLSPLALEYLEPPCASVTALNAGGWHSFQAPSTLQRLAANLLRAGDSVKADPQITQFFQAYGYPEGCAMCLLLAMKASSPPDLKELALRAALARAYRPSLESTTTEQGSQDPWVPSGYKFTSSALYEGLGIAVSRLLRPFWNKPAVVVTEGRTIRKGSRTYTTPAKVELLLEEGMADQLRAPLQAMRQVMGRVFTKAIRNVPLSRQSGEDDANMMDIDDQQYLLTTALDFQRRSRVDAHSSTGLRPADAEKLAEQIEERKIHSLFRLVSRTGQLLGLLSHLRRAHAMPDLPEVDWGQLHGISFAQLVQSQEGHDRIETTLNSLVTSAATTGTATSVVSADAKAIAQILSEECYHFFSPGSRYAYFGFQAAQDALTSPVEQQSRRMALTNEAISNLEKAAEHWCSPSLITGRTLQNSDVEPYEKLAERALECGSPLAKACALLVELDSVPAVVDICLRTAANFGSQTPSSSSSLALTSWRASSSNEYHWEKGLYHRRHNNTTSSASTSSAVTGTQVTSKDAIKTCHALVFYHLSRLLNSPITTKYYRLGERMVSVCVASSDVIFLKALFGHLLKRNHVDVLLRIDSPQLEKWLLTEKKEDLELLLKYYQVQEKHTKAGHVAWTYATAANVDRDLSKRIDFLIQAADSFTLAQDRGEDDSVSSGLTGAMERLTIAKLQGRIRQAISASKYEVTPEVLAPLENQLLVANDLINKYAIPYELYDCCILLLHACRYNNLLEIERFWKSLLCDEILPCSTRNEQAFRWLRSFVDGSHVDNPTIQLLADNESASGPLFEDGHWLQTVEGILVRLGEEIFGSGDTFAFPVEYIISCLEGTLNADDLFHYLSCECLSHWRHCVINRTSWSLCCRCGRGGRPSH